MDDPEHLETTDSDDLEKLTGDVAANIATRRKVAGMVMDLARVHHHEHRKHRTDPNGDGGGVDLNAAVQNARADAHEQAARDMQRLAKHLTGVLDEPPEISYGRDLSDGQPFPWDTPSVEEQAESLGMTHHPDTEGSGTEGDGDE